MSRFGRLELRSFPAAPLRRWPCWLRLRRHVFGRRLDRGDRHGRTIRVCQACGAIRLALA